MDKLQPPAALPAFLTAYNDPSAQRARMEAAGFNPYNMNIDSGSASTSGAQSSPASGSQATASQTPSLPAYTGYASDFQSVASGIAQIGNAVSSSIDSRLTSAYGDDLMKADIMSKIGGNSEWLTDVYIFFFKQKTAYEITR